MNFVVPVPQQIVLGVTALEGDVGVLAQPDQLAHIGLHVGAFAVIDRVPFRGQATALR